MLLLVMMAWLPAFAGSLSTDYPEYQLSFNYLTYLDIINIDEQRMEPGFVLSMYLLKNIGLSFTGFLFILLLFENYFFIKYIESDWFSVLTFSCFILGSLYNQESNVVRQLFSISLLVFSIRYIYCNQLFKYVIIILIASLFHKSAIILLPLFYLHKIPNIEKGLISIWVISFLLRSFGFKLDFSLFFSFLDNTGSVYASYEDYEEAAKSGVFQFFLLNTLQIPVTYILLKGNISLENKVKLILITVATIIDNTTYSIPIMYRLSWYFNIFTISTPSVLAYYFKKNNFVFLYIGILTFFIMLNFNSFRAKSFHSSNIGVGAKILNWSEAFK